MPKQQIKMSKVVLTVNQLDALMLSDEALYQILTQYKEIKIYPYSNKSVKLKNSLKIQI